MEQLQLVSQVYKLYELRNSLTEGVSSYEKMAHEYETLIDIVKNDERSKELNAEFLPGIEQNLNEIRKAIVSHARRIACVEKLIALFEADDTKEQLDSIITMTFTALGIAGTEPEAANETPADN